MREALMASRAFEGLTTLLSLAVFLTGLVFLIRGKFTLFGRALRGRPARVAGMCLIAQFVVGWLIYMLLYSSLELGSSATPLGERVAGSTVIGVEFLLVVVGAIAIVRSIARSQGERVIVQPEAAQRHHGCLLALLILMTIAAGFSAVGSLVAPNEIAKVNPDAPAWAPVGIRIMAVISLVMVASLVAIWKWRKWGAYLFALLALCVLALNLLLLDAVRAIAGLIGPGLVLAFVFREWKYYR